ncbi:VOC family protein [Bauldia sp.]|uniref:VOC family protein n=1 Tax=Bauldia sp. TaxID=2575872 RepID=UPI003BA99ECE
MEQRLSMITLGVGDLDRARRFYEDGLGWQRGNDEDGIAFYQLPGIILGLWPRRSLADEIGIADDGAAFSGLAIAYNTRSRDEVDQVLKQAEGAGARILKPASDVFWGGYSGYFADPDGHPWEVAWNPTWPIAQDGQMHLKPPEEPAG